MPVSQVPLPPNLTPTVVENLSKVLDASQAESGSADGKQAPLIMMGLIAQRVVSTFLEITFIFTVILSITQ